MSGRMHRNFVVAIFKKKTNRPLLTTFPPPSLSPHVGTNEQLRQLTVGPITDDVVSELTIPLEGVADDKGVFTYLHNRMARPQRNYALIDIQVPFLEQESPTLSLRLIGAVEQPPRALLGPIIGRVTATTAVILLEVELPAVVTCILTDILTRKTYKFVNTMPGRRPKAFVAKGLMPERRYAIHFNGIARWNQHRGGLTTTPEDDQITSLSLAFVQADRPNRLGVHDPNPWHMLHEQLEYPWGGPDVVVHMGGQVNPARCFDEVLTLLRREGAEKGLLEEAAKDRIRSVYRFAWSLPHTKEVLARTSNVMIWNDVDLSEGFDQPDGGPGLGSESASWGPTLLRLTRSVFREYQRQLWEPVEGNGGSSGAQPSSNWSPLEGRGGVSERMTLRWGPIGICLLDTFGARLGASGHVLHNVPSLLSDQHWRDLAAFMSDETLRSLVIASPTVVLDDSPDDAVLKALHPSQSGRIKNGWPYNRHDLKRMLHSLFAWKNQSTVKVEDTGIETTVRDVLIVSGGSKYGMTSTIASTPQNGAGSGSGGSAGSVKVRQLVLPPITDTPSVPSCELKGHIDEGNVMSYSHGMASRGRGFGIVRIGIDVGDCEGGRGVVDGDVYVADMNHEPFELGQKLMRLPNWVESALKEAYATAEDSDDDDEDDDDDETKEKERGEKEENDDDDDDDDQQDGKTNTGGKKKKGGVLGSGALQARRALKQVFQTKSFRTAVSKTYERYYTEGTGMEKKHLLEAVRHFFYKVSVGFASGSFGREFVVVVVVV